MSLSPFNFNPRAVVQVRALATLASWNWQEEPFRPKDHRARFIVHAVKGATDKLAGKHETLNVGPNGSPVTVTVANFELIADYWAAWAASIIKGDLPNQPIILTPLPSSKAVAGLVDYRPLNLARRVGQHIPGSVVWDGVRFRQERLPVHSGGSRATIFEDMIFTSDPPPGTLVPIDDVFTQGAHLGALMRRLPSDRWPTIMITGGKTENAPPEKVINPPAYPFQFWG